MHYGSLPAWLDDVDCISCRGRTHQTLEVMEFFEGNSVEFHDWKVPLRSFRAPQPSKHKSASRPRKPLPSQQVPTNAACARDGISQSPYRCTVQASHAPNPNLMGQSRGPTPIATEPGPRRRAVLLGRCAASTISLAEGNFGGPKMLRERLEGPMMYASEYRV